MVYDLAMEEVNFERLHRSNGDNAHVGISVTGLNEEVFLAQLHRRSLLLNKEFQDAVTGVVTCHVALERDVTIMANAVSNMRSCSTSSVSNMRSCSTSSSISEVPIVSNHRLLGWSRHKLNAFPSASASLTCEDSGGPPNSGKFQLGLASGTLRERHRKGSLQGASDIFTESTDSDGPRGTQITCKFSDRTDVVDVVPAPIKTLARMQEKVLEYSAEATTSTEEGKQGNGWPQTARILDPVRTSIVCNGPAHILEAFQWFSSGCEACPSKPICRFKNRFSYAKEELLGGCECTFRGK